MLNQRKQKTIVFLAVLIFAVVAMYGSAAALTFNFGRDTTLDVDTVLTYSAGWRAKDAEEAKLGKYNPDQAVINSDDGNENFNQWDMINNKISALMDVDLRHKNFGLFLRGKGFYDRVYMTDNANESPATNNALLGGLINKTDEFPEKTEDVHGQDWELLDLFAYGDFPIGDGSVNLRVGQQVISWGESMMISGGIAAAQSPLDAAARTTPGAELKEFYLPTGAVFLQAVITNNLSISTYYQYEWEKNKLMESGSFFQPGDMLDEAGNALLAAPNVAFLMRVKDDEPSDDGQYGVSISYVVERLNDTEFNLYFINYHERSFFVETNLANPMGPSYHLSYPEDVKLYGASFSAQLGDVPLFKDWNFSGEISYRQDRPVDLDSGRENANILQAQVSGVYVYTGFLYTDFTSVAFEVGSNRIEGIDDDSIPDTKDKSSWGAIIRVAPKWLSIFHPKLDIETPVTWVVNPNGNSVAGPFTEGSNSFVIGANFKYANNYRLSFQYVEFNNSKRNIYSDRDYLQATFKYSF